MNNEPKVFDTTENPGPHSGGARQSLNIQNIKGKRLNSGWLMRIPLPFLAQQGNAMLASIRVGDYFNPDVCSTQEFGNPQAPSATEINVRDNVTDPYIAAYNPLCPIKTFNGVSAICVGPTPVSMAIVNTMRFNHLGMHYHFYTNYQTNAHAIIEFTLRRRVMPNMNLAGYGVFPPQDGSVNAAQQLNSKMILDGSLARESTITVEYDYLAQARDRLQCNRLRAMTDAELIKVTPISLIDACLENVIDITMRATGEAPTNMEYLEIAYDISFSDYRMAGPLAPYSDVIFPRPCPWNYVKPGYSYKSLQYIVESKPAGSRTFPFPSKEIRDANRRDKARQAISEEQDH